MTSREGFNKERALTRAYQVKLESSTYSNDGTATGKLWQTQELGKINFTASGERSIGFANKQGEILYASCHLIGYSANNSFIINVTQTGLTVYSEISGTVFWSVIGANP